MQLLAIIRKELLLLSRDIHGLLLLFVMPVVFILIMSFAMKSDFDRRSGVQLDVLIDDRSASLLSKNLLIAVTKNTLFKLTRVSELEQTAAEIKQAIKNDEYSFLATIPIGAFVDESAAVVDVLVAPATSTEMTQLFVASLREAAVRQKLSAALDELKKLDPEAMAIDLIAISGVNDEGLITVSYDFSSRDNAVAPTSVQQNVPAWLVFSMFFVVVPLANTLINERQLGTLRRVNTIAIAKWKLMAGKIIPYFVINQIQVIFMFFVGMTIVPMLGGDQLTLGHSLMGLALMSASLSLAALGYGMLIAVICRTTEQATTLGGAGNIILAALGGIMVPTFVMPAFMQSISVVSPMSWGLQGFLDILLRGGGVTQIWLEAMSLLFLGVAMLCLALYFYHHTD